jgi:hypothetical protein
MCIATESVLVSCCRLRCPALSLACRPLIMPEFKLGLVCLLCCRLQCRVLILACRLPCVSLTATLVTHWSCLGTSQQQHQVCTGGWGRGGAAVWQGWGAGHQVWWPVLDQAHACDNIGVRDVGPRDVVVQIVLWVGQRHWRQTGAVWVSTSSSTRCGRGGGAVGFWGGGSIFDGGMTRWSCLGINSSNTR